MTRVSLQEVKVFLRQIWRQVVEGVNADTHMVYLETPQTVAAYVYYDTCIAINRKNQRRCDDLKLDPKLGTLSIFGVSVVETYNVATQFLAYEDTSHVFFYALSEWMIDNDLYLSPTRPPSKRTSRSASYVPVRKRGAAYLFQICKKNNTAEC